MKTFSSPNDRVLGSSSRNLAISQQALAVYEYGTLRLLGPVSLAEQQKVRVEITVIVKADGEVIHDLMEGTWINTGIPDFTEHFDGYRFGLRVPPNPKAP